MQLQEGGALWAFIPHLGQSYHHIFLNSKKPSLGRMRGSPEQVPGLQQGALPAPEAASNL